MRQVSRRDFATVVGVGATRVGLRHPETWLRRARRRPRAAPRGRRAAGQARGQGRRRRGTRGPDPSPCSPPTCWSSARTPCRRATIEKIKAIKGVDGGRADRDGPVLRRRAGRHLRGRRPGHVLALHPARHRADRRRSGSGSPVARSPSSRRSAASSSEGRLHASSATRPTPRASTSVPTPRSSTRAGRQRIDAVVNYKWAEPLGMRRTTRC